MQNGLELSRERSLSLRDKELALATWALSRNPVGILSVEMSKLQGLAILILLSVDSAQVQKAVVWGF